MPGERVRPWAVKWMYGVVAVHLIVGALLPWIGDLPVFDGYHRSIEASFWNQDTPAAARA